jgi:metal-responsive CopG/Arc/MetJ family transcriptional regulator
MPKSAIRTHVVLPRDLVEAVDELVGQRTRSEFVEEALREKVARERMARALIECVGVLHPGDYPEWDTPEKTSEWVHKLRQEENEAVKHAWQRD